MRIDAKRLTIHVVNEQTSRLIPEPSGREVVEVGRGRSADSVQNKAICGNKSKDAVNEKLEKMTYPLRK